jgi:endonuclease-3
MSRQNNISKVVKGLKELYPDPRLELNYGNAFELLVAVILSAQCTDERVNQVTVKLFQKYSTPQKFIGVPQEELEQDIRPTGFYRNKAKLLKACCQKLVQDFSGKVPTEIDQLVQLPGVGRKTAAMVLGNAFGIQQGIAVDTHVKRVVNRLNLSKHEDVEKIEAELLKLIPRDDWTLFSNATILFGRRICQAKKPLCPTCPFREWCPSPDKQLIVNSQ